MKDTLRESGQPFPLSRSEVREMMNQSVRELEGMLARLKSLGLKTIDPQSLGLLKQQMKGAILVIDKVDQESYMRLYNSVEEMSTTAELEKFQTALADWIKNSK